MTNDLRKEISRKYCLRFGQIAVESGLISEAQLAQALAWQVHQEISGSRHLLLGEILFEKDWMSAAQIDQVLTDLFRNLREEEK